MTTNTTKKMVATAMLCAMAYTVMFALRIPIVSFLKYEAKDVIILFGGFIYGPLSAITISVIVSVLEWISVSDTGIIGCIMNIVSSCAFVLPASLIYHRRKTLSGAIIGLTAGVFVVTGVMVLWNYLLTPIYMGYPREAVAKMLLPVFVPFNLFKSGLNSVLAMLLFKPVVTALNKADLIEPAIIGKRSEKSKWIFIAVAIIAVTVILLLSYNPAAPTK